MSGHDPGAPGLMLQFLAWIAARPRSYDETMDAWRTSCPRLTIWEDAVGDGLVEVEAGRADGQTGQGGSRVVLTRAGQARLPS